MPNRDVSPDSSTQPKEEHRKVKKRKQKHHNHGRSHKNKKKKKEEKEEKHSDCEAQVLVYVDSSSSKNSKKKNKKRKSIKQPQSPAAASPASQITTKPLEEYVDDREELYKELLSTISRKELKEMLPDILKKKDLKEVKKLCLEHLKVLPRKKLKDIISGQDTSPSGDEEEDSKEGKEGQLAVPAEQQHPSAAIVEEEKDAEIFEELITAPNQEDIDELVEGSPENMEQEQGVEDAHNQVNTHDELPVTLDEQPTSNEELELKELEFRARALKSLVQARERQMKISGKSPFASTS